MHRVRIQDLMTARLCAILANIHRTNDARVFVPADFALFPEAPRPGPFVAPPSGARAAAAVWDEKKQLEVLEHFNKAFGGYDRRPGRPGVN